MDQFKKFRELYNELSRVHNRSNIFADFLKICAISMYNSFSKNQEMEQEYLRTINAYNKEEQSTFAKMCAELIMLYENSNEVRDILGEFFQEEGLNNKYLQQFFTPSHISDLMAEIILENENTLREKIEERGFITMSEPACGAGGMILSLVKALKNRHINYQEELLVEATDISEICVYMTYIQLSLYGIPAIVYCGNTLTGKILFKMETPLFFLQHWKFMQFYRKNKNNCQDELIQKENKIIIEKSVANQNLFKELIVKENNQISLW